MKIACVQKERTFEFFFSCEKSMHSSNETPREFLGEFERVVLRFILRRNCLRMDKIILKKSVTIPGKFPNYKLKHAIIR